MKVLFIGEGKHDVGKPEFAPQPQLARGVVATLARRICPGIAADSIALTWKEITVLNPFKRNRGHAARLASAIVLAQKLGCAVRSVLWTRTERPIADVTWRTERLGDLLYFQPRTLSFAASRSNPSKPGL